MIALSNGVVKFCPEAKTAVRTTMRLLTLSILSAVVGRKLDFALLTYLSIFVAFFSVANTFRIRFPEILVLIVLWLPFPINCFFLIEFSLIYNLLDTVTLIVCAGEVLCGVALTLVVMFGRKGKSFYQYVILSWSSQIIVWLGMFPIAYFMP